MALIKSQIIAFSGIREFTLGVRIDMIRCDNVVTYKINY